MPLTQHLLERLPLLLNRADSLNGKPFPPDTVIPPPKGMRRSWVHYGVMVPDLPAPHHFFNVLSILGTAGAQVFDNDFAVRTSPRDTVYLLSATGAMPSSPFRTYSLRDECAFTTDGRVLHFGEDLSIEGRFPHWRVQREHADVRVQLDLHATRSVSHFARIPGAYHHWSLLCEYNGTVQHQGRAQAVQGLCTLEYAAGMGPYSLTNRTLPPWAKLPLRFFTYQILNIDAQTQLLLVEVLGPRDLPIQRRVYVRGVNDLGRTYSRAVSLRITGEQPQPHLTPDGFSMRLPSTFLWRAE
ncbi:MAG: hypothetical protein LPK85_11215, partial [Gammaproteobacteria bacterium]|nr:hypothetical protein [Gammaproteobacteria bacterium]